MMPMSEPGRRHHLVPRFLLRRFANEDERLIAYDRANGGRRVVLSVSDATVQCGFYDVPAGDGMSGEIEDALGQLESMAAPIVSKLAARGLHDLSERDRYRLCVFMGMQLVRGADFTEAAFASIAAHDQLRDEAATPDVQERVAQLLGVPAGAVGDPEEVAGSPSAESAPPEWWLRTAGLAVVSQQIAEMLWVRRWVMLSVPNPGLLTSDRPIVLFRSDGADGEPTGFVNADLVIMPVSRTNALLMLDASFDITDHWADTQTLVDTINRIVAVSSYRWVFHHPDESLPNGLVLPEKVKAAHAGQIEIIKDGVLVRVRSRVISSLPTPPLGWHL